MVASFPLEGVEYTKLFLGVAPEPAGLLFQLSRRTGIGTIGLADAGADSTSAGKTGETCQPPRGDRLGSGVL